MVSLAVTGGRKSGSNDGLGGRESYVRPFSLILSVETGPSKNKSQKR